MERKRKWEQCVIHLDGIKHDSFTRFSDLMNPNDRLALLKSIRDRRLAEPLNSPYRMTDICQGIPDEIIENQGYHRGCYLTKTAWNFALNTYSYLDSMPKHWQCNESEVFSEIMKLPSMSIVVAFLLLHRFLVGTCCRSTGNWMNQEKCFLKLWNLQVQLDKRWTIAI